MATNKELARKLSELEKHLKGHDQQIQAIFEAIRQLMSPTDTPRKPIGFEVKEGRAGYGKRAKGKEIIPMVEESQAPNNVQEAGK